MVVPYCELSPGGLNRMGRKGLDHNKVIVVAISVASALQEPGSQWDVVGNMAPDRLSLLTSKSEAALDEVVVGVPP